MNTMTLSKFGVLLIILLGWSISAVQAAETNKPTTQAEQAASAAAPEKNVDKAATEEASDETVQDEGEGTEETAETKAADEAKVLDAAKRREDSRTVTDKLVADIKAEPKVANVIYVPLRPPIITNFRADRPYLVQIEIQLVASGKEAAEALRYHESQIRHILILYFSNQEKATILSTEGRNTMRAESLTLIQTIMEREEGYPAVEKVLFTRFVIQ